MQMLEYAPPTNSLISLFGRPIKSILKQSDLE